jgi:hypothetical protein
LSGRESRGSPNDAFPACQDAVREKANRQYGFREIDFSGMNAGDNPGRNDTITGSFNVRRGNYRDAFRFSCSVDLGTGRIRNVELSQAPEEARRAEHYAGREDAISACQHAAEQRMQLNGYRNVHFGALNNDPGNNGLAGTATAQRDNNGRAFDFEIRCSVNPDNGSVRLVRASRR